MRNIIFLASLAAIAPASPSLAAAGGVATVQAEPSAAETNAVDAARAAVAESDVNRLLTDRDYAREILGHLDTLTTTSTDPEWLLALDTLRLFALMSLERPDEMRAAVARVLASRSSDAEPYSAAWWAALSIPDFPLAATAVEQAARNVPGIGWAELRRSLGREQPAALLQALDEAHDDATRVRFAEALFRIGWPGGGDIEGADFLRTILIDSRLARGDNAGAAGLAASLTAPTAVLPVLLLRRYDNVLGADADRLSLLRSSVASYDRETAAAVGASPGLLNALYRARHLRSVGRDSEALALLMPFTRDVGATVSADENGMWLVNDAVYILLALGRNNEAVALMERLVALPVGNNQSLIGPYINHARILGKAGRHAEALAYARRIEQDHGALANDYGRTVLASTIICELAALGRADEARPLVARIEATGEIGHATLLRAHLCLNDMAAAEALVVRRLAGDDPQAVLLAFQTYEIAPERAPDPDPEVDRLMSLRDRPAVRAAIERVGRIMSVPLARSVWTGI